MNKFDKVESLLKKGERYYANRVHIDIYGKGVIAGFHSRDEEVRLLRQVAQDAQKILHEDYCIGERVCSPICMLLKNNIEATND